MWLNISSSLTHSPRFCFVFSSQNEFSMSPIGVGFLTIPLPEPVTILMIDCSTLDCGEREERGPQRQKKKKKKEKREERGAWTIPQGQSDVQSFVFSGEISGLCSRERTGRVTGGLAGTDVLTQWTRTWLVAYSLKVKGLTSSFQKQKKDRAESRGFPPVGLYQGKMLLR